MAAVIQRANEELTNRLNMRVTKLNQEYILKQ